MLILKMKSWSKIVVVTNEPTRVTLCTARVLDLMITNCPSYSVDSGTYSPPTNCDHSYIYGRICMPQNKKKASTRNIEIFQT